MKYGEMVGAGWFLQFPPFLSPAVRILRRFSAMSRLWKEYERKESGDHVPSLEVLNGISERYGKIFDPGTVVGRLQHGDHDAR